MAAMTLTDVLLAVPLGLWQEHWQASLALEVD